MADVFVSYARPDRDRVKSLVRLLEEQGWSVWWDREIHPGETFERVIDVEIQAARCVVAIWTKHSVDSDWVQAEAGDGMDRGILVPVMFDEVRVPVAFRRMDAANFVGWPKRRNAAEVQRFREGVAQCVTHEPAPASVDVPQTTRRFGRIIAGFTAALLIAAAVLFLVMPDDAPAPVDGGAVTVIIRPFAQAPGGALGLEYELERRLRASPGLAARVTREGAVRGDYLLTGEQHGDLLTVELMDRNGVSLMSKSVEMSDDLAVLADQLSRDLLVRLGRATEVVSRFDTEVPPEAFRAYLAANRLLRQSISPAILAEAEQIYTDVLARTPRFAAAHAGLCRTYMWLYIETRDDGYVGQAEQHCHRALTLDDQDSSVHSALGMLYRETGMMPRSVDSYRRALALAPYSTDAMRGLGDTLVRTGAADDAERWLRDAVELEPSYWENYHVLGGFLYGVGRFDEAMEAFLAALALAPAEGRVLNNLGTASFMSNEFETAIAYWRRASEAQPSAATFMNLGSAYFFLRDFTAAANMYIEAQQLTPDDHFTWGGVGESLYVAGDDAFNDQFARAIELAAHRLTIDPEDHWTTVSLGAYHAALGEKERALEYADRALTAEPDDLVVLYGVAVSHARLGDFDRARANLQNLVRLGYPAELIARDANFDGVPFSPAEEP